MDLEKRTKIYVAFARVYVGWYIATAAFDVIFAGWLYGAVQACPLKTLVMFMLVLKILGDLIMISGIDRMDDHVKQKAKKDDEKQKVNKNESECNS